MAIATTTPIPAINRRPSRLAAAALEVARTKMGVKEVPLGSNAGPDVSMFLKSVGLTPGYAWCAAFVYWATVQAAAQLNISNPLPRTGGVLAMFQQAKGKKGLLVLEAHDKAISPDDLRPGDIFILAFSGGHGHTGRVDRIVGDSIVTIEGNTDAAGGREGIGVFDKRRKVATLRGIIRILD